MEGTHFQTTQVTRTDFVPPSQIAKQRALQPQQGGIIYGNPNLDANVGGMLQQEQPLLVREEVFTEEYTPLHTEDQKVVADQAIHHIPTIDEQLRTEGLLSSVPSTVRQAQLKRPEADAEARHVGGAKARRALVATQEGVANVPSKVRGAAYKTREVGSQAIDATQRVAGDVTGFYQELTESTARLPGIPLSTIGELVAASTAVLFNGLSNLSDRLGGALPAVSERAREVAAVVAPSIRNATDSMLSEASRASMRLSGIASERAPSVKDTLSHIGESGAMVVERTKGILPTGKQREITREEAHRRLPLYRTESEIAAEGTGVGAKLHSAKQAAGSGIGQAGGAIKGTAQKAATSTKQMTKATAARAAGVGSKLAPTQLGSSIAAGAKQVGASVQHAAQTVAGAVLPARLLGGKTVTTGHWQPDSYKSHATEIFSELIDKGAATPVLAESYDHTTAAHMLAEDNSASEELDQARNLRMREEARQAGWVEGDTHWHPDSYHSHAKETFSKFIDPTAQTPVLGETYDHTAAAHLLAEDNAGEDYGVGQQGVQDVGLVSSQNVPAGISQDISGNVPLTGAADVQQRIPQMPGTFGIPTLGYGNQPTVLPETTSTALPGSLGTSSGTLPQSGLGGDISSASATTTTGLSGTFNSGITGIEKRDL